MDDPAVIAPGLVEVSRKAKWSTESDENLEVGIGRNLQSSGFKITEPDDNDQLSGGKEVFLEGLLDRYQNYLEERTGHQLGFPCTLGVEYDRLLKLVPFSINNLGDPFVESNYGLHSKQFEVGVLDWFARLWGLGKNEYWGYVASCGTEGNLHGILTGRELFPEGVLYASRESHYSVFKAARMYKIDCVKVDALVSGQIDCFDLEKKLLQNKSRPAIVNLNIGTTVKAAVDDLDLAIKILETSGFKDRFYIHCDGALLGAMLPFIERAPKLTFEKPIGSVSVSGHKFAGCPLPCGVHITRKSYINVRSQNLEWISSKDTTIMGSRSGHAALFLWYALNRRGYSGFRKEVERCLLNARYLKTRISSAGIGAMLNEFSNTVVFERPRDEEFVRKWQLLCEGNIAHVVVMPNVTVEQLGVFADELVQRRRVWSRDGVIPPPCIAVEVGRENCACPSHFHRQ